MRIPVEAVGANRAYPTLGEGVRVRRLDRRADHLDVLRPEDLVERAAELVVAIMDQEPDGCSSANCMVMFARLLGDPASVRVRVAGELLDPSVAKSPRRQDPPRSKPLPQALHRPQPPPAPREPANDLLTSIDASSAALAFGSRVHASSVVSRQARQPRGRSASGATVGSRSMTCSTWTSTAAEVSSVSPLPLTNCHAPSSRS